VGGGRTPIGQHYRQSGICIPTRCLRVLRTKIGCLLGREGSANPAGKPARHAATAPRGITAGPAPARPPGRGLPTIAGHDQNNSPALPVEHQRSDPRGQPRVARLRPMPAGQGQQPPPANTSNNSFQPSTGNITTGQKSPVRQGVSTTARQGARRGITTTAPHQPGDQWFHHVAGRSAWQHPTQDQSPTARGGSSPRPQAALRPAGHTLNWADSRRERPARDGGAPAGNRPAALQAHAEHDSPPGPATMRGPCKGQC